MRELYGGLKVIPDEEIFFNECILYIISREEDDEATIDEVFLHYGYDEPISLAEITEGYPNVVMLIEDNVLRGRVFRYNNHNDGEWELVGRTVGFA